MSNSFISITLNTAAGAGLGNIAREACSLAEFTSGDVKFTFNDIELTATKTTIAQDLIREFNLQDRERYEAIHGVGSYDN